MRWRVYVSDFGQVLKDVIIGLCSLEEYEAEGKVDEDLERYLTSRKFQTACPLSELVERGSVYVASHCDGARSDLGIDRKRAKTVGGHAPSSRWFKVQFPEASDRMIFRRLPPSGLSLEMLELEHRRQGEGGACHLRTAAKFAKVFVYLRIHLTPAEYQYRSGGLSSAVSLLRRTPVTIAPFVALSDAGHELRVYLKPPGCLSEPHVSSTRNCLTGEIAARLEDKEVHPVHRLDGPVAGFIACRVMPRRVRGRKVKLAPCEFVSKTYKALAQSSLSKEEVQGRISSLKGGVSVDGWLRVVTFCPPGNMFDRASPVLTSSVQHAGWVKCETMLRVRRDQLTAEEQLSEEQQLGGGELLSGGELLTEEMKTEAEAELRRGRHWVEFEVVLFTGRRHQIRSVLAYLGFPLLLDHEYLPLKDFDCANVWVIERAAAVHESARAEWFKTLREKIEGHKDELTLLQCTMWAAAAADPLLKLMSAEKKTSSVIGLVASFLKIKVSDAVWETHEIEGWWHSFF